MDKKRTNLSLEPPSHQPSKCTCVNLRRASRAVTRLYDRIMEPSGLKVTQFSMLRNIMVSGPLTVTELAQILRLERTTLVRNLKSLEARSLVARVQSGDPRTRPIAVTDEGRKATEASLSYWQEAQAAVEGFLGPDNLEKLVCLLMDVEALAD